MILSLLVLVFVAMPLYLLNNMVMPDLLGLQNTYARADAIAERAANGR